MTTLLLSLYQELHFPKELKGIEKYPNIPWDWDCISNNPNITMEIIEKYRNKIKYKYLSQNKFTYENKRMKKKEAYWLLEGIRTFNKTQNLVLLNKYI
jgi:hypothetical protein